MWPLNGRRAARALAESSPFVRWHRAPHIARWWAGVMAKKWPEAGVPNRANRRATAARARRQARSFARWGAP